MNKCAVQKCDKVPSNPAATACNDHPCMKDQMGVIAGSGRYAACLNRLSIMNAIDEL